MCVNKDYNNKHFSILGDSISTFEGISEPKGGVYYTTERKIASGVVTVLDTWWGQVVEQLGGKLLVNDSWSGSTVCWNPQYQVPSYGCSDERTSSLGKNGITPDVIIVFMGINDWGNGFQVVGNGNVKADEKDCALFSNAYRIMLEKLRVHYPKAEIWCMTLPISSCSAREGFAFPYYYAGRHIVEYCDAIREVAQQDNCRVIDLYNHSEPYDTLDGFHPNASGMRTIARAVITAVKE